MTESNKTPLMIAFIVIVVLFLVFGGVMNGGMMGQGSGWMWIPTLLTLGLGILLGWILFGQKK
jgi:ABC-type multidrug transport system permease subunit